MVSMPQSHQRELSWKTWNLVWQGGSKSPNTVEQSSCKAQAGSKHPLHSTGRGSWGIKKLLSWTVTGLRSYPSHKLRSQPATRSWILAETKDSQARHKWPHYSWQLAKASWSFAPQVPLGWYRVALLNAAYSRVVSLLRTLNLGILQSCKRLLANLLNICHKRRQYLHYLGQKTDLPSNLEGDTLCIFQGCLLY